MTQVNEATNMSSITAMNASTAEKEASKVVFLIQECVQTLRSVDQFKPGASPTAKLDTVLLDKHFHELIPKIQDCCGETPTSKSPTPRDIIVQQVLWPLLTRLAQCYAVLDKQPSSPPHDNKQTSRKPPPPPGLLSIQNYTDIAVLLEFLVCTSILPLLQDNILLEPLNRARYLPKSMAGRIPRASLLWACSAFPRTTSQSVPETILELRTTAMIIGQVVILDRFRPMLLPRHVVDLYAAIFQADALEQEWKQSNQQQDEVCLIPLHYNNIQQILLSNTTTLVDSYTQARAYQTLLSRGTAAPLWLRQRVSSLLNELACRDLNALVKVFVQSAGEEMTSASLRLARALVTGECLQDDDDDDDDDYIAALCRQLVTFLSVTDTHEMGTPLDQSSQARVLTVLAVLDQLPVDILSKHFFSLLSQDLVPKTTECLDSKSTHRVVRRLGVLLSSLAPSYNPCKIGRLLLSPIAGSGARVTIVSQLLRIATIESVVMMRVKNDAVFALQCAIQTLLQSSFPGDAGLIPGEEVAALALMYSLAPTSLDIQGYRYSVSNESECESDTLQDVTLEQRPESTVLDVGSLANDMERMSKILVEKVLLSLTKQSNETSQVNEEGRNTTEKEPSRLPSTMFYLLLLCYFSTAVSSETTRVNLPSVFAGICGYIQLATMLLLPLLCEKCSPESLLLADGNGVGILSMMALILDCSCSNYGKPSDDNVVGTFANGELFCGSNGLLVEIFSASHDDSKTGEDILDIPPDETWISISSIVLTLLVTMLEMGSQRRSDEEENILSSMLPSLELLARFKERDAGADQESFVFQPELAEMAAHAMALIAARSQISQEMSSHDVEDRSEHRSLMGYIREARSDLESEQPPIRARGVAALTRISHSYTQKKEEQLRGKPLVTIIDDKDGSDEDHNELRLVLAEIVRVSVAALADKESYVYLAAIQSIVSAADASPREVIPTIARAICSGCVSSCTDCERRLSPEQRIKLAEALLFTIQRRGKAIYEFVPLLMNLFLHGTTEEQRGEPTSSMDVQRIQQETHGYFVRGKEPRELDDEMTNLSSREELDLRIRTGGPVFQTEENDVVRAGCITILSALVSSTHPSAVAGHCSSLMHFAMNALKLEVSRPVRRATAVLCYELYAAMLCGQDQDTDLTSKSLAVQMVSSGEEELHATLTGCVKAIDTTVVSDKLCPCDPAFVERCKEALDARDEADQSGVLAAAKLFLLATKQEESRVAEIVRARLNEGTGSNGDNTVTAMKGLRLDKDSLGFADE